MVTSDTRRQGGKKMDRVHRVCYEALVGPIPDNQVLDHLCYTPRCFNPSHMLPATHKANCENKTGLDVRNKSGFRGVYWDSSQRAWRACVRHNGRLHYAGRFATPEEAGQAALELRQNLQFRDSTTLMS